jgi:hypothetical protein
MNLKTLGKSWVRRPAGPDSVAGGGSCADPQAT